MEKYKKNQFEGYVRSYLDKYLEGQSKEDFSVEFYDYLLNEILSNSIKTLLILFFAFKKESLLKGDSSEERYRYFDNYSSTEEFHGLVNRMYPLLKQRLDSILHNHIINYNDLNIRVKRDKEEIHKKFGFNMEDLTDCHIKYGVSDYHRGLKSICIIEKDNRRIIGLVANPVKLNEIRQERLKALGLDDNANYANVDRINLELEYSKEIMEKLGCIVIDVSYKAIEETAGLIIDYIKKNFGDRIFE